MDTTISLDVLASDYRFALQVMEESHHLGLDDAHARVLHEILQRRIAEASITFSAKPAKPLRFPGGAKLHA